MYFGTCFRASSLTSLLLACETRRTMSALPCGICKVEHFSGEHAAGVARVYKTFPLILEKYPTLSRVWEGKCVPCVAESKRTFCVFPGRRVSVFWRKAKKRLKRQCSLPEHVTKRGKVLISLKLFCQRTRVRGRASTRARSASAFSCSSPFSTLGLFAARVS